MEQDTSRHPTRTRQRLKSTFVEVEVDGADYRIIPRAVDGGRIVDFLDTRVAKPDFLAEIEEVYWLQFSLNKLIDAGLYVDGDYGRRTRNAVRKFQRRHRLDVDGIAGPDTRAKIRELLGE